ncbi:TPA: hypothetical protein ACKP7W_004166 [Stenotrophomonas maltophilia]|uniref:hypothetical protein n=1 Tax=Stenotrophomonas TaxID=40323 RepID=UPI0011B64F1B|nr:MULTISPECIES: hypothetical protein [Stenotrophomonas]
MIPQLRIISSAGSGEDCDAKSLPVRFREWIDDPSRTSDMRMVEMFVVVALCTWGGLSELQARLPEARFITADGSFASAIASLVINFYLVFYLFCRRNVHGDHSKCVFGSLLILSASVNYLSFELLSDRLQDISRWLPPTAWQLNFALLISTVRNVIAFGFGAIGAGIVSGVLSRHGKGVSDA